MEVLNFEFTTEDHRLKFNLATTETPLGLAYIVSDGLHLRSITLGKPWPQAVTNSCKLAEQHDSVTTKTVIQLREYFAGRRKIFDLPYLLEGTDFQKQVWHALATIPYGETYSYKQHATLVGRPKATRAVGGTNAKNPLWIVLPCHRVVGSGGQLTGYAGGLEMKRFLLRLEGVPMTEPGGRTNDRAWRAYQ